MISSFKAAAITAAVALILAMPLAAQNATEELGPLESNTYKATAGLFGNDVDNFVDVHSYGDVNPEKWFGFITGDALDIKGTAAADTLWFKPGTKDNKTGLLSAGYARQLGGIYLGLWYQGNIAQVTGGLATKTSSIAPDYDAYKTLTSTVKETTWKESWLNTTNQIEVLVGVAGQGIKVGFYESLFSNVHDGAVTRMNSNGAFNVPVIAKVTDYQNGVVEYESATDEFYTRGGYIRPYLGWGSTFNIAGIGMRPYANLGATFKSDKRVDNWSNYTKANGTNYFVTSNVDTGYDFSYIRPEIGVGAWFDLAAKESGGEGEEDKPASKASTTLGLEYNLGVYIYDSSYAATGLSGGNVRGTVLWNQPNKYVNRKTQYLDRTVTETDIQLNIDEITELRHEIIPTYIISGDPAENLSLGFKASLPIDISTYTSEQHSETHVITDTRYKTGSKQNDRNSTTITRNKFQSMQETNFGLGLDLAIGASYKLIPNRFSINAGVSATPCAFTNTVRTYKTPSNAEIVTVREKDGLGNVTNNSKTVTTMPQGGDGSDWLVQKDQVESNLVWDGFSGNITGGFTFFFNQNIALDLAAAWGKDSFNIDIADVNVLISFKF